MNKTFNLSENSTSYYDEHAIYKIFSDAEDFPDFVFTKIKDDFKGKTVLDLGCGNGKYSIKIAPYSKLIFSLDKSFHQLQHIKPLENQLSIQSDAQFIALLDNSIDIVFSSWMLGTVLDLTKRLSILNEVKRVLKPNGKIILIENAPDSEFEILRGRHSLIDNKTAEYHSWLMSHDFIDKFIISSYFQFKDIQETRLVFDKIWGNKIINPINDNIISHDIVCFEWIKK